MTDQHALLLAFLGATGLFLLCLLYGHARGEINLWTLVRETVTKELAPRKVAEVLALIVSTIFVMYAAVADEEPVWVLAVYLSAWVARSLLGFLAQAKGMAMGQRWSDSPYQPQPRIGRGQIGPE